MANFRRRGNLCSLVLNHVQSELGVVDEEVQCLYADADDTKEMPQELKAKIGPLIADLPVKLLTYCKKTRSPPIPSRRRLSF
jgi:hypothetical protein